MDTQLKELSRAYGFDEVAIVPGETTINPDMTNTDFSVEGINLSTPIIASAMDAITNPGFAVKMSSLGGMAVVNLEGVQTRHEQAEEIIHEIATVSQEESTVLLQKYTSAPIRENLVGMRVEEIKKQGGQCAVSITPANTKRLAPIAAEAGADTIVVQSTVTTARHYSRSIKGLRFPELLEMVTTPILLGKCVGFEVALELMETGIHGVLVGVGPGAACTTREVTGVGVPQVTATISCAAAREEYYRRSGRYIPIITDGGIRTGGDLCKAFVSGADAVMLGTPMAQAEEAPGLGFNWGMANADPSLPRGTRVKVGVKGSLEQILFGPSNRTDGTQNLMGALRTCMGMLGASNIREMHNAKMIVAPAIKTEGKHYQLGMD